MTGIIDSLTTAREAPCRTFTAAVAAFTTTIAVTFTAVAITAVVAHFKR